MFTSKTTNKVLIIHVKQSHADTQIDDYLNSTLTGCNVRGFEEVAQSQFMVAQTIINHPTYLVLQEGCKENLNKGNRHLYQSALSDVKSAFASGFPANYLDLSEAQKICLVNHQAAYVLYLLGIIDNVYQTSDSSKIKEYLYKIEYENNKYFAFAAREIDALNFAKQHVQLTNNPNILLIFGGQHNFEKRIALLKDPLIIFQENIETCLSMKKEDDNDYCTEENVDPYHNDFLLSYARVMKECLNPNGFKYFLDLAIKHERNLRIVVDQVYGGNILHWASFNGDIDVVKICLEKTGRYLLDTKSKNGSTPLHNAAFRGHTEVVKLLLDYGADAKQTNVAKKTAFDLANEKCFTDVINLFKDKYGSMCEEAVSQSMRRI